MKYRVHRLEVDLSRDTGALEKFLNGLSGSVIGVMPHVRRPSLAWIYGLKRNVIQRPLRIKKIQPRISSG